MLNEAGGIRTKGLTFSHWWEEHWCEVGYDTALGLLTRVDLLVLWSKVTITTMQAMTCGLILQYRLDQRELLGWLPSVAP